jgi:hypothetical protein
MRPLRFSLVLILAALSAMPLGAQQDRKSPHETIHMRLGEGYGPTLVTVTYGRPYTKDPKTGEPRVIWGGLVPWGKADRLGADEATLLLAQQAITIGNLTVPAGAYTLYTVPSDTGPSLLGISTRVGQWGIPVDTDHDLGRVEMTKATLDTPVHQLTLALEKDPAGGGVLKIMWEDTVFSVPLKLASPSLQFPQASPAETVKQRIGLTDIEVVYSRPSAKGRVMLGGNNPYGQVWRTGANSATRISFSTDVTLEGSPVPAGPYELFTIPGKDEWTIILQKPLKQWGAYTYDPKNDFVRVTAKPEVLAEHVETFTIDFNDILNESATLDLIWENTRVPVRIGVVVVGMLVPKIDAAMAGTGKKPYDQAAVFYSDHGIYLDKAAAWMDAAIAEHPDAYYLMYQKARILAKQGDKDGATAEARKSIELASKDGEPAKSEYIRLNEALIASLK